MFDGMAYLYSCLEKLAHGVLKVDHLWFRLY